MTEKQKTIKEKPLKLI